MMREFLAAVPLFLIAGCMAPEKAPAPPLQVAAPPPPPPAPPPVSQDWRDWPLTPGTWAYRADEHGSSAMFGRAGEEADLILRCDLETRRVILSWRGVAIPAGGTATITTSNGSASYPGAGAVGVAGRVGLVFAANNPFLDKLAFSRGRFVLNLPGDGEAAAQGSRLIVPAWSEPARAIEDCRK